MRGARSASRRAPATISAALAEPQVDQHHHRNPRRLAAFHDRHGFDAALGILDEQHVAAREKLAGESDTASLNMPPGVVAQVQDDAIGRVALNLRQGRFQILGRAFLEAGDAQVRDAGAG